MLNRITSQPPAQTTRDLSRVSSQQAAPRTLSAEPTLPTESFVRVAGDPVVEKETTAAVAPVEVREAKPSRRQVVQEVRPDSAPQTLSLLETPSTSLAAHESVGSTVADLAYAGMSQDSENPLFVFGNSWLSKIPKAEGKARSAVQAAILEKLSGHTSDFAIGDVKGVFASAQSKLDRSEDVRVLNDALFTTLAATEPDGNALEIARGWKKSVPGGEPAVRNAITDTLLESFLDDPDETIELSNFRPVYDGVMGRLERADQRTATDAFFRVLSRESDSNLLEFGNQWLRRYGNEDGAVKAAITDGIVDQVLTHGGDMEAGEFAPLYGKIQGQLSRDEDLQSLTNGLFDCIGKESESSLIELAKAWVKEVPAGEVAARSQIVNSFLETFLANPTQEHDTGALISTYYTVMERADSVETKRELNDAFMGVVKKESDGHRLIELSSAWTRSIPVGEKAARNAVTDGVLEVYLDNPEQGDLNAESLSGVYQSVRAKVGHDDDVRVLNDSLLRTISRDTDSKLLEVGQGWLKAIPSDNRAARAAVTDTVLNQFMTQPTQDLETAGLPALAQAAVEQAGHDSVADDVVSGLLGLVAKGNERKDLVALAKQPYSAEGLQQKLDALSSLVEGMA